MPKRARGPRPGLTTQILAALVAGCLVGWRWPEFGERLQILATIFVRLVLVVIGPLILATLVVGIAGQGSLRRLGRLAAQAFGLFVANTCAALAIASALANVLQPGRGIATAAALAADVGQAPSESFWIRLFPRSIADALARGDVLQIVVFGVLFGIAVSMAGNAGLPLLELFRSLAQAMYKLTNLVMMAAPLGAFGAAAALIGQQGFQAAYGFLRLIIAVYLGLAFLLLVCYPTVAWLFRVPLRELCRAAKEPVAVAFATASASGAMPKAMENMEAMGVPGSIVSFTMGTGLNFNPSGSTVYVGVATLFVLQAYRMPMGMLDQLTVLGVLFVATKGIGGVPRSSLVVIAAALPALGLSQESTGAAVGLLLGIDPLLDMPRTAVNTAGNCLASALVARWQGVPLPAPHANPAVREGQKASDPV
jgi:proton glutamate symport protein